MANFLSAPLQIHNIQFDKKYKNKTEKAKREQQKIAQVTRRLQKIHLSSWLQSTSAKESDMIQKCKHRKI